VVETHGVFLTRQQMEEVMRAFRLHARRVWDRGVVAGVWNRDALFLPETAPIYVYVLKAKVGFRVAWETQEELARVAARILETVPPQA
jgi:hypothetical protein